MAIESESFDMSIRRRKFGTFSNQSSSSDFFNNNNNNNSNEKLSDSNDSEVERDYDADATTLDPVVSEELKETMEKLSHDETLNKLKEVGAKTPILPSQIGTDFSFKRQVVWQNAFGFLVLHICALIGVLLVMFGYARLYSVIYSKCFHAI